MNTQAKFQEVIEMAEANNLHTIVRDNEVTVYLVSTDEFNATNGRPVAIRATIRNAGRKTIAFSRIGTRTSSLTRTEAITAIANAND